MHVGEARVRKYIISSIFHVDRWHEPAQTKQFPHNMESWYKKVSRTPASFSLDEMPFFLFYSEKDT